LAAPELLPTNFPEDQAALKHEDAMALSTSPNPFSQWKPDREATPLVVTRLRVFPLVLLQ